ncbi:uncharacterized protein LOC128267238 [Anopheles cruzii]|uniref:uncharacterized protein LOC128267238 n=1 Tax=Anopheles cruzii TaxID=68878 RepID=UPI0022EC43C7|nr:uncharacterized protein LOC128267238 [Anopheles cruzii]
MDALELFHADELVPENCLDTEWIDEDEVFAILKQWETRSGNKGKTAMTSTGSTWNNSSAGGSSNSTINSSNSSGSNGTIIHQSSFNNDSNISPKPDPQSPEVVEDYDKKLQLLDDTDNVLRDSQPSVDSFSSKYVDTRTFVRPKKKLEASPLLNITAASSENPASPFAHHEVSMGRSPLLNVQIGGPVTPSLANSATGNRLLMQRSWLNDVSPPCSIMNSMEYSANEKFTNSLITSGDFSSVGCLLNTSDEPVNVSTIASANYNGYSLYSVIEDRQRLENLCLGDESTLTKDCNISRTDLNGIESVSGVSTMQNSYESGTGRSGGAGSGGAGSGGTGSGVAVSGKSSFEEEESPNGTETNSTIVLAASSGTVASNDTFLLPEAPPPLEPETLLMANLRATMLNGGTYDARRPRNFNTYRKPRSSLNQTFDALPKVDPERNDAEQTFNASASGGTAKHTVMNSTFGIVGEGNQDGGVNSTFTCNRTINLNETFPAAIVGDNVPLLDLTFDAAPSEYKVPFGRTFKRRSRPNGTLTEEEDDPKLVSPLRPETVGSADSLMMVQSTPFHGPVKRAVGPETSLKFDDDVSPIASTAKPVSDEAALQTPTSTGGVTRNVVRRSRNLDQDLRSEGSPKVVELDELETDEFDVQIRRLPASGGSKADISNFLDAEKRISLQHFEEFEKSIMESEHSGLDFDEVLNSLTADVRRSGESSDKLRQSLDNIKKRHSRINLEKQQQDELKRKLHQQSIEPGDDTPPPALDNKLADSMTKSTGMSSSSGSERLLNRRSRYNEDANLTFTAAQPEQKQLNTTITVASGSGGGEVEETAGADRVSTGPEVEAYDRKNRDRFKTIRIIKRWEDGLPAPALPDADQTEPLVLPGQPFSGHEPVGNGFVLSAAPLNSTTNVNSAFSRVDQNSLKSGTAGGAAGDRMIGRAGAGMNHLMMKTDPKGPPLGISGGDELFKKPQAIVQPVAGIVRSNLSKQPRYYGAGTGLAGGGGALAHRKDLTLALGNKSSSTDSLEHQRAGFGGDYLPQQQSRLTAISKLGGGSGGLIGTGRYSQYTTGLQKPQQPSLLQPKQQQHQQQPAPALKSPMGTKSKSYHSLTFAQANATGYGGSSGNLSKVHGSSGLQLKLKHNASNTELKSTISKRYSMQSSPLHHPSSGMRPVQQTAGAAAAAAMPGATGARGGAMGRTSLPLVRPNQFLPNNSGTAASAVANQTTTTLSGVQMRTAGGLAKTSRLGLVRPSSGYFSYSTHRKHPDSDNESINSLSSSSASSRGSLYRVDSQSIANNVQTFTTTTRTHSTDDVNGAGVVASSNGLLARLNGTGGGLAAGSSVVEANPVPTVPGTIGSIGMKQPTNGVMKPSGLRPPSALRAPAVRSGLPRPTSYIRR